MHEKLASLKAGVADQLKSDRIRKAGTVTLMGAVLSVAACTPAEIQFPTGNYEPAPTPIGTTVPQPEIVSAVVRNTATTTPASTSVSDLEKLKEKGCPNTRLGIRVTEPKNMELVPQICFGRVRVAVDHTSFYTNPKVKEAIATAQSLDLKVLAVLNPHQLEPLVLPNGEAKTPEQQIKDLLTMFPNIDLEVGNEPDNDIIKFWQDQDLETFTKYFKKIYKEAIKINPNIKIIAPATVDIAKTIRLLQLITSYNIYDPEDIKVDLTRIKIAVHVYNEREDIRNKLGFLKQHFEIDSVRFEDIKDNIVVTEIAVNGADKKELEAMLTMLRDEYGLVHNDIFKHELEDGEGNGLLYHFSRRLDKRKSDIPKNWAIKDLEKFPEHRYSPANRALRNNPRRFTQKRYEHRRAA